MSMHILQVLIPVSDASKVTQKEVDTEGRQALFRRIATDYAKGEMWKILQYGESEFLRYDESKDQMEKVRQYYFFVTRTDKKEDMRFDQFKDMLMLKDAKYSDLEERGV